MTRLVLAIVVVVGAGVVLGGAVGCGSKQSGAIAELTKSDGPVEREAAAAPGAWHGAAIGTRYFLGDAARTADRPATLKIVGGRAVIVMQGNTVLRFGGAKNHNIAVEAGAIDLIGSGSYSLDIGDVKLINNGTIRITAQGDGKSSVELTVGEATVSAIGGETIDLVVGKPIEIGLDVAVVAIPPEGGDGGVPGDAGAGVDDAGVPDAAPPVADTASVAAEITGKKAEVQLAGETDWKALPAGTAQLAAGTTLRLGAGSSAKLTARGTTLDLGGGTRVAISEQLGFAMETGAATVTTAADGAVSLPGGALALKGSLATPAAARVDVGARDTKIQMTRGGGKLTGAPGSTLDLNRGESAVLQKGGVIRVVEAIPGYYDFSVLVGDTMTIHDPKGTTAVRFQFGGKCAQGGIVELDKDSRFRTAKVSSGKESANLLVSGGSWSYRLRCTSGGGDESSAVASGRVAVTRDSGTRALPKTPPSNPVAADGRTWRISYQSAIPNLVFSMKGTGSSFRLTLAQGGKAETFEAAKPSVTVPGSKLKEGTYTYWFVKDGVKQDKVSTLVIDFDQTAPQVYIESPQNGKPWTGDIEVRGAVLPGWSAAVESATIPIDKQRRFHATVSPPTGALALAIRLSHPQRGVHYYLRRPK